ncbi:MAG: hypothetical protein LBR23_01635 [Spirochaetaceae bacterium]|jgi:flagellar motor switch protein FliG|nr:hypothetical protein [Spirochaetaceae bacterium]
MTFRTLKAVSDYAKAITEKPENAVILAYLEPEEAVKVLQSLPSEAWPGVIRRIAGADWESAERILKENFPSVPVEDCEAADGIERAVQLLRFAGGQAWQKAWRQVIDILEDDDPALAEEFNKHFFVFDDIVKLDDHSVQKVMREVDSIDLCKALYRASAEAQEKIFRNMSRRAALMLREDMDHIGPVRLKDVEEAQYKICSIVRRLGEAGELPIPGPGDDELVTGKNVLSAEEIEAILASIHKEEAPAERAAPKVTELSPDYIEEILDALAAGKIEIPAKYRKNKEIPHDKRACVQDALFQCLPAVGAEG